MDGTYSLYVSCRTGLVVIEDSKQPDDPWRVVCDGVVERLQIFDSAGSVDLHLRTARDNGGWMFAIADRE